MSSSEQQQAELRQAALEYHEFPTAARISAPSGLTQVL